MRILVAHSLELAYEPRTQSDLQKSTKQIFCNFGPFLSFAGTDHGRCFNITQSLV